MSTKSKTSSIWLGTLSARILLGVVLSLTRFKYYLADKVKRNPYAWSLAWSALYKLPFLLPHDKSYLGFKLLLKPEGGLFLDVGANNGMSALSFDHVCGRQAQYKILSIEAASVHKPLLERLKGRIKDFDFRILGAGDKKAELSFYTPSYNSVSIHTLTSTNLDYLKSCLKREFTPEAAQKIQLTEAKIPVIPHDDLKLNPAIIKIDAEGFDYKVLLGLQETIDRNRPYIMLEYSSGTFASVSDFMQKNKYSLYEYDIEDDIFRPFDHKSAEKNFLDSTLQSNPFCFPNEKNSRIPIADLGK